MSAAATTVSATASGTSMMGSSHMGSNYRYQPKDPSKRYTGIIFVVLLHAVLGYALVSGLARKGLDLIKKPLEAVVIQEVIIPPPPPPPPPPKEIKPPDMKPPKVEAPPPPFVPPPEVTATTTSAVAIESVAAPPVVAAVIAPPPVVVAPPAPPAPPAPKAPTRSDIGIACPTQVKPAMPRKATQDGTQGEVVAQATIRDGSVRDVKIISGPAVFHQAVRTAMMQYKCLAESGDTLATQRFNFVTEE